MELASIYSMDSDAAENQLKSQGGNHYPREILPLTIEFDYGLL